MTALGTGQIKVVFQTDSADKVALFALVNFTTGDTADLATWFSNVKRAALLITTANTGGIPTFAGSVVTLTPAGATGDAGYLFVWGSAAPTA